jgi:hypothetical protein
MILNERLISNIIKLFISEEYFLLENLKYFPTQILKMKVLIVIRVPEFCKGDFRDCHLPLPSPFVTTYNWNMSPFAISQIMLDNSCISLSTANAPEYY